MELKWLRDFIALSEMGNFRIAAQQRSVSQPAFSRRIQALEAWIKAPLIDRSCQPSKLTEAGRLFLPQAQKIVALADAGRADVKGLIVEGQDKMRFATLATLAQVFLPGWLKAQRSNIQASQFIVRTEFTTISSYFKALEDGKVDFFVIYEDPNLPHCDKSELFPSLTLATERLIPVVSPKVDGTPSWWLPEILGQPIPCLHKLSVHSPWPIRHHMESKYADLVFKSVYDSSVATTLKAMAIEGFGLAWMPNALVKDDLERGILLRAAPAEDDILVDIKIYRCMKNSEARLEKFWKILSQSQSET